MDSKYAVYLQSNAWRRKRLERLQIAQFRCSACSETKAVHVHHLTYARIFDEDMEDLLPLCDLHHRAAEEMIRKGLLPRTGNVLFLAAETLRLIIPHELLDKNKPMKEWPIAQFQEHMRSNPKFMAVLSGAWPDRSKFKKKLRSLFPKRKPLHSRYMSNGFAIFDRYSR